MPKLSVGLDMEKILDLLKGKFKIGGGITLTLQLSEHTFETIAQALKDNEDKIIVEVKEK